MRILFTGGGSGGHIYPILAVVRELNTLAKKKDIDLDLVVVSDSDFGRVLLESQQVRFRRIKAGKLRRYPSVNMFWDFALMPLGLLQGLYLVWQEMPDCVMGNGGYVEVPVAIAAWLYRIPLLIHESDVVPGLANRLVACFAKRIGVSFSQTLSYFKKEKTALVGNPVRKEVVKLGKKEPRDVLNLQSYKKGLLVLGGSQGARKLNQLVLETAPRLLKSLEIVHQCGKKNKQELEKKKERIDEEVRGHYHLKSFLNEHELACAYSWADLVVARAGAGLIFEIAACGLPSILVPLPGAAYEHQKKNAYAYSSYGACRVLEQPNLKPSIFVEEVKSLVENPVQRRKMSKRAKSFAKPQAGRLVAEELIELGKH